jgi:hypothetical protein
MNRRIRWAEDYTEEELVDNPDSRPSPLDETVTYLVGTILSLAVGKDRSAII